MAFSLSGFLSRLPKPKINILGFHLQDIPVRGYAARKGTREKALKKKRAMKLKKAAQEAQKEKKKKITVATAEFKRTVEPNLPFPPKNVDVYFFELYKPVEYSVKEAASFHKEELHPTLMNSPVTKIQAFFELNMTGEKKTQLLSPWKSTIKYPNYFEYGYKKKILVLCKEECRQEALEKGADVAGGPSLIKEIKRGEFDITIFNRVVGQVDVLDEISTIRSKLKLLYPRAANGTLVAEFGDTISMLKFGVEYVSCLSRAENGFGWIDTVIGTGYLESEQIEENFKVLLANVYSKRPKREGTFIEHVWCSSSLTKRRFKIDWKQYIDQINESEDKKSPEKNPDAL